MKEIEENKPKLLIDKISSEDGPSHIMFNNRRTNFRTKVRPLHRPPLPANR